MVPLRVQEVGVAAAANLDVLLVCRQPVSDDPLHDLCERGAVDRLETAQFVELKRWEGDGRTAGVAIDGFIVTTLLRGPTTAWLSIRHKLMLYSINFDQRSTQLAT